MKLINGKKLAEKIKDNIAQDIDKLHGYRPNLAIILVGHKADSKLYVNLKEKQARTVGIDTSLYKCPQDISQKELLEMIKFLNKDETVDGILVQLPLPKHIKTSRIVEAIDPHKDIDGFHSYNLKKLTDKKAGFKIVPPVYGVILEMLRSINYDLSGRQVCLVAKADIFEKNLAELLAQYGAKVTLAKITDKNLASKTSQADLLITAIGQPGYITKDYVKKDAVIIDIGISHAQGKVCGDVDENSVKKQAAYLTPVPGGVGPMTIAMAFKNILDLYKKKHPLT